MPTPCCSSCESSTQRKKKLAFRANVVIHAQDLLPFAQTVLILREDADEFRDARRRSGARAIERADELQEGGRVLVPFAPRHDVVCVRLAPDDVAIAVADDRAGAEDRALLAKPRRRFARVETTRPGQRLVAKQATKIAVRMSGCGTSTKALPLGRLPRVPSMLKKKKSFGSRSGERRPNGTGPPTFPPN